jgi:hypothetical protein
MNERMNEWGQDWTKKLRSISGAGYVATQEI